MTVASLEPMLIFGYGPRAPKDRGAVAPLQCPNCHNLTWFHLITQRRAVSLFFVPVIPVRSDDALVCATCRYALALGRPDAAAAMDMISDSKRHENGQLTDVEYGLLVDSFWQRVAQQPGPDGTPEGATWRAPAPPEPTGPTAGAAGPAIAAAVPTRRPEPPAAPPDPFAPQRVTEPAHRPDEPTGAEPASGPTGVEVPAGSAAPPDPATRAADPDPGWYPDPYGELAERYWDGGRWTEAAR